MAAAAAATAWQVKSFFSSAERLPMHGSTCEEDGTTQLHSNPPLFLLLPPLQHGSAPALHLCFASTVLP